MLVFPIGIKWLWTGRSQIGFTVGIITIMGKFKPIYLTDEDVEEIATFFQIDKNFCRDRIWNYDSSEMSAMWENANPQTYEEIREFYRRTELYVWDLTQWHASTHRESYNKIVARVMKLCPPTTHPRVLDFGGGIGTEVISFAKHGYSVVFADVPGITAEFAKHRLRHRGLKAKFLAIDNDHPNLLDKFDIIICFDVLEHLPNPEDILCLFHQHLTRDGVAAIKAEFNDPGGYPFHLHSNFAKMQGDGWNKTVRRVGFIPFQSHIYRKGSLLSRAIYDIYKSLSVVNQLRKSLQSKLVV